MLLVPDTTICNLINDFQLVGVALDDTSLSFVVSDMLNPLQQNTLNGTLTQVGFIQTQRKQRSTAEPCAQINVHLHTKYQQQRCPADSINQQLQSIQNYAQYYVDLPQTIRRM